MKQEIICKIFGHKIDLVDRAMLNIKNAAINRKSFSQDSITCKRCKRKIKLYVK